MKKPLECMSSVYSNSENAIVFASYPPPGLGGPEGSTRTGICVASILFEITVKRHASCYLKDYWGQPAANRVVPFCDSHPIS